MSRRRVGSRLCGVESRQTLSVVVRAETTQLTTRRRSAAAQSYAVQLPRMYPDAVASPGVLTKLWHRPWPLRPGAQPADKAMDARSVSSPAAVRRRQVRPLRHAHGRRRFKPFCMSACLEKTLQFFHLFCKIHRQKIYLCSSRARRSSAPPMINAIIAACRVEDNQHRDGNSPVADGLLAWSGGNSVPCPS